ncbi:MAG: helix-turn-helix transcriptional regulator [Clostridia bacterium]|nr:helix-turn-helix transcriptional regulator [Clostridia bacterium]
MKKETFGEMIAKLRKDNGMTQAELADKMGVTDKAVSKWERDLSMPDTASLPRLAEIFGISVDELMEGKSAAKNSGKQDPKQLALLVMRAVALAMGVAVVALNTIGELEPKTAFSLLGIGLACIAINALAKEEH